MRHGAPQHHVDVGGVLQLDVQRVGLPAAGSRGAERAAEQGHARRQLRRQLPARRHYRLRLQTRYRGLSWALRAASHSTGRRRQHASSLLLSRILDLRSCSAPHEARHALRTEHAGGRACHGMLVHCAETGTHGVRTKRERKCTRPSALNENAST